METAHITLVGIVALLSFIFGIRVYLSDRKNNVNRAFALFAVSTASWMICDFSLYQSKLSNYQTILNRADLAIITLMVLALVNFINVFPNIYLRIRTWAKILILSSAAILIFLCLFTKSIIDHAFMQDYGSNFQQGQYFYIFAAYSSIFSIFVVVALINKFIRAKGEERTQLKLLFYGLGIFLCFNLSFNLFVPMVTHSFVYGRFGTYSTIFFVGFTAYAILKAHLFDLKIILTETAIIIINVILAIQIFPSKTIIEGLLRAIFLMIVVYGSVLLLRSVKKEIKQKEELQVLAKKLDEANAHLEELDEAKDNFLSMAAHELNTPIAAIEGYLSMIIDEKMGGAINPKMKTYLENVFTSSKRLAGLVKDLLNVSRIESNRIHLLYAEASIETIIDQSIAEVKIKADEVGHKLTFEKPKHALPKTWLDVDRITEIVINIIGNAIKYTEPPGKIVVSAHTDGDKIVVAIEDNGRGIPKDKSDHVFEKFVQVNVLKDQVKGTGLGMFITKNLIELHKGKVWFKSSTDEKDHGTTFYFSLPILKKKPFDPHEGEGALFQTGKSKPAPTETEKPAAEIKSEETGTPSNIAAPETASGTEDEKEIADTATIKAK